MLDLLQSVLAFVLTMLGLATIVTVILEMLGRFTRRRGRVMRHVLEIVFEKEIQPILKSKLDLTGDRLKDAIDVIVASPIKPEQGDHWFFKWSAWLMKRGFGADQSSDLTARDFLIRLSRTEAGTKLYETAKDEWESTIERIETRYDELCTAASDWFKSSSAVGALLIGVALAFALNLDGMRVFDFYLKNPAKAEAVVNQAEAYLKTHDEAQKRLDAARKALDDQAIANEPNAREAARQSLDQLAATYQAIKTQERGLVAAGLPMGAAFFPYCRLTDGKTSADPRCLASGAVYFVEIVRWFFVILVSGVLIGLGGPFWYNAASGLLRVTQMMRGKVSSPEEPVAGNAPASHAPKSTAALKHLYQRRTDEMEDAKPSAATGRT